jgi:predicted AAA+ superfamily ATPase
VREFTQPLIREELSRQAEFVRLVEGKDVFNMATQFGGGKSHSLTALYHLAYNGEKAKTWTGVDRILRKAEINTVPEAAVAVFMGREFDSLNGRGGGDEPVRKTPWGEIAWQLGREKSLAVLEQHEKEFIDPCWPKGVGT